MAIYDNNGTTNYEIGKVYDYDGTSNHQIDKVYDNPGLSSYLIYSAQDDIVTNGTVISGYSSLEWYCYTNGFGGARPLRGGSTNTNGGLEIIENEYGYHRAIKFNTAIDLSNCNSIVITATGSCRESNLSYNGIAIALYDGKKQPSYSNGTITDCLVFWRGTSVNGNITLSTSNLSGTGYLTMLAVTSNASNLAKIKITNVAFN